MSIELKTSSGGSVTLVPEDGVSNTQAVIPQSVGALYGKGNVLGTVSQSGGVPTGAIIQRGSNANGEFVRYADGTLICTIGDLGVMRQGDDPYTWTYPLGFVSSPAVTGNIISRAGDNNWYSITFGTGGNTGIGSTSTLVYVNSSSTVTVRANLIAIGRWY